MHMADQRTQRCFIRSLDAHGSGLCRKLVAVAGFQDSFENDTGGVEQQGGMLRWVWLK
jgi:hypothetical protein